MGIFSPRYLWRPEEILTPPTLHSAGHQPQTEARTLACPKDPCRGQSLGTDGEKGGVLSGAPETACLQARPQPSGGQTPALCTAGSNRVQGSLGRGPARVGHEAAPASCRLPPPRPPLLPLPIQRPAAGSLPRGSPLRLWPCYRSSRLTSGVRFSLKPFQTDGTPPNSAPHSTAAYCPDGLPPCILLLCSGYTGLSFIRI